MRRNQRPANGLFAKLDTDLDERVICGSEAIEPRILRKRQREVALLHPGGRVNSLD